MELSAGGFLLAKEEARFGGCTHWLSQVHPSVLGTVARHSLKRCGHWALGLKDQGSVAVEPLCGAQITPVESGLAANHFCLMQEAPFPALTQKSLFPRPSQPKEVCWGSAETERLGDHEAELDLGTKNLSRAYFESNSKTMCCQNRT